MSSRENALVQEPIAGVCAPESADVAEPAAPPGPDTTGLIAFSVMVLMVGTNPVAIRFSNRELEPFWGAGVRFSVAAVLFGLILLFRKLAVPRGRALAGAALYGLLGIAVFFAFGYWGLTRVKAGLGAVLFATVPLLTFLFAIAHGLEPFRWRALLGAVIVVGGVAVVFGDQLGTDVSLAALLSLLAASAAAAETNIVVKKIGSADPIATNVVAMTVGALGLLIMSFVTTERHVLPERAATWLALGYLMTVGTIGVFGIFLFVLKRWNASTVSYEFVIAPFVTTALGAWLLDENVRPITALGAAFVLAGVYVGALWQGRANRRRTAETRTEA